MIIIISTDSNKSSCYQISLEENMPIIRQSDFSSNIIAFTFNDTGIFCLTSRTNSPLDIYNMQLQYIKSIGNSSRTDMPWYLPSSIRLLENRNAKYFALSNSGFLNIIDEIKGNVLQTIRINAEKFVFDSNGGLIVLSNMNKKVSLFDSHGLLLYEIDLLNAPTVNEFLFLIESNDILNFFDINQLCFYKVK
jgi:hypothetical protein